MSNRKRREKIQRPSFLENFVVDFQEFGDESSIIPSDEEIEFDENQESFDENIEVESLTVRGRKKKKLNNSSSSSQNATESGNIKWNNMNSNIPASKITFKKRKIEQVPKILKSKSESVLFCFHQFFTKEMLELIVVESNLYAKSHSDDDQWAKRVVANPVTIENLMKYLGIRLALGLSRSQELKDMYSRSFPYNFQACQVLGRRNFEDIHSSLHCQSDTTTPPTPINPNAQLGGKYQVLNEPKVGRVLELFSKSCANCKYFSFSQHLSLDEMVVRFQGRSTRVYSRLPKPTSEGIKIVAITDFNGFLIDFIVEQGPGKSLGIHAMVVELCSKLNKGHIVYMDNLYTSVKTALELAKMEIFVVGTMRANRGFPEKKY